MEFPKVVRVRGLAPDGPEVAGGRPLGRRGDLRHTLEPAMQHHTRWITSPQSAGHQAGEAPGADHGLASTWGAPGELNSNREFTFIDVNSR